MSQLVRPGLLSLSDLLYRMSTRPAQLFKLPGGSLATSAPADVVILDPDVEWTVDPKAFFSKSRNTPFGGRKVKGRAEVTIVRGRVVHDRTGA